MKPAPPLDLEQMRVLLKDIATTAKAVECLALNLDLSVGDDTASAMSDAIVSLCQRIGWAADLAHGPGCVKGGAAAWMLPPTFVRDSAEQAASLMGD